MTMITEVAWMVETTRQLSEARVIQRLAGQMYKKLALPRNRVKGVWENLRPFELVQLLQKEQLELASAVVAADWNDPASVEAVASECADVAAFAAMILDNARRGVWKR